MASNYPLWDRGPDTDDFADPRPKQIFGKICSSSDTVSYMDDSTYGIEKAKAITKQVFVTKKSFDSYEPTRTVSLTIKRIVEMDKIADVTFKSFENSIIRCTTSVESVQVPFSTFRELWNKNNTEPTDFGFKLKKSDTITITIFLCKYCFDAYGENHLLTDSSTVIITSDISGNDWKDERVELKGKKTYIMTFSIDQVKDIDIVERKPKNPDSVNQQTNLNVERKDDQPSDEPLSRQRRGIVSFARIASGLRSAAQEVGKGVAVEVVKDWTLQLLGRGSEIFKDLRKAAEMSDAYFQYSCKVYGMKN